MSAIQDTSVLWALRAFLSNKTAENLWCNAVRDEASLHGARIKELEELEDTLARKVKTHEHEMEHTLASCQAVHESFYQDSVGRTLKLARTDAERELEKRMGDMLAEYDVGLDKLARELVVKGVVVAPVIHQMEKIAARVRKNYPLILRFSQPLNVTYKILEIAKNVTFSWRDPGTFYQKLMKLLTSWYVHAELTTDMHSKERDKFDARNKIKQCYCKADIRQGKKVVRCNNSNHVGAHVWRLDGCLVLLSTCSKCNNPKNTKCIGFFRVHEQHESSVLPETFA